MKKLILILSISFLILPVMVGAHGEAIDSSEEQTGADMMRYLEDKALGEELHEEMEDLMTKMMAGNLTEFEADRLVELMREYPGPQSMMMGRMMGMNMNTKFGQSWDMMSGDNMMGAGSFWPWFMTLIFLVWLIVGILVIVWLLKQISKK